MTGETKPTPHEWQTSKLNHGTAQCKFCFATCEELAAFGELNHCYKRAAWDAAKANARDQA